MCLYGAIRASRGYEEPYNVRLWSLGNEAGYGHMEGENTSYGYYRAARKNAEAMLRVSPNITLCSSGPYPNEDWAAHSAKPLRDMAGLVSLHFYCRDLQYHYSDMKTEYEERIADAEVCRAHIRKMAADLDGHVKISFDEWNAWYEWFRPTAIYSGLLTARLLQVILEEAELCGIAMACQFQAINEGIVEVHTHDSILTAEGQAFAMMQRHSGGNICFAEDGILATEKNGILTVTCQNAKYDTARKIALKTQGTLTEATIYYGEKLEPFTRFDCRPLTVNQNEFLLPPLCMAVLTYQLDKEKKGL